MIDWTSSMQQTFEYYTVDPISWKDQTKLTNVKSCTITRDIDQDTLGSATFDVTGSIGEAYIRVYLIAIQNGIQEKIPLGTFMVQTPSSTFNGKVRSVQMDAYTPLLELKENSPAIGYHLPKGKDVMEYVYKLTDDNCRASVVKPVYPSNSLTYDFVSSTDDTWLSYIKDLMTAAYVSVQYKVDVSGDDYVWTNEIIHESLSDKKDLSITTTTNDKVYEGTSSDGNKVLFCVRSKTNRYRFDLDEMGRVMFAPEQDVDSLQPVWTFDTDNKSILYPDLTTNHDLYGIPNVVEVLYSDGKVVFHSTVVNDDPNSPISTVNRGRSITHRVTSPELYGTPTQDRVDEYAKQLLKALSAVEYTISYTHGYCPVRAGDCVRVNYSAAGLSNVKAKVISQTIKCVPGCPVSERAVFTNKLWG